MRRLTVLIYMAADNDLGADSFAAKDIHEMERFGSSDDIAYVVQVDRFGGGVDGTTLRGLISRNPDWKKNPIQLTSQLIDLGETNTGDPRVLMKFITDSAVLYPAENFMLILWGHGTGWRSDQIERAVGKAAGAEMELAAKSAGFGEMFKDRTAGLIFRQTMEYAVENFVRTRLLPSLGLVSGHSGALRRIVMDGESPDELIDTKYGAFFESSEKALSIGAIASALSLTLDNEELVDLFSRAVALDVTDHSALDSLTLKVALDNAKLELIELQNPQFRFSLIAFDACLMGGLETVFQLRDYADVIVVSQEEEPRTGWRYDLLAESFMNSLAESLDFSAISRGIVNDYIVAQQFYLIRLVTLSSVRTEKLLDLAEAVNSLGAILEPLIDTETRALQIAEKTSTRFRGDKDFLDLGDFVRVLKSKIVSVDAQLAIEAVLFHLSSAIITSRHAFAKPGEQPTGISIYFPAMPRYDSGYDLLDLSVLDQRWATFVKKYHLID